MFGFNSSSAKKKPPGNINLRVVSKGQHARESRKRKSWPYLLVLLFALGGLALVGHIVYGEDNDPTIITEEGDLALSPDRQAKLDRELEEIDNAQQYALIVTVDGYFPCYSCPDGVLTIFLYKGEVWKYGVTRKGEQKRYPGKNYGVSNVVFVPQFEGNYAECLKMEKIKIYNYPLLPEAQKRLIKLIRPPGNAVDT